MFEEQIFSLRVHNSALVGGRVPRPSNLQTLMRRSDFQVAGHADRFA